MKFLKIFKTLCVSIAAASSLFCLTSCDAKKADETLEKFELYEKFNSYILDIKNDGTLDQIISIWDGYDESKKVITPPTNGENGIINVAVDTSQTPHTFFKDNDYAGMCVDIVYRFARENNYLVNFLDYTTIGSIIAAVKSGVADFGCANIAITKERMKNICFSQPYYTIYNGVLVANETATKYHDVKDLDGLTAGYVESTVYGEYCEESFPNSPKKSYPTYADCLLALKNKEVDFLFHDECVFKQFINDNPKSGLSYFGRTEQIDKAAFVFNKFGPQLNSEFTGMKIGVLSGSYFDQLVEQYTTNNSILYYETFADCAYALETGKIDAYVSQTGLQEFVVGENNFKFCRAYETLYDTEIGAAFPFSKGKELLDEFNEFLRESRNNGLIDKLIYKWIYNYSTSEIETDYASLVGTRTLKVATTGTLAPYTYYKRDSLCGFDIELAIEFAKARGYKIEFEAVPLQSALLGLDTYDFAITALNPTDERKQMMYFSDSYLNCETYLVTSVSSNTKGFNIGKSFYNNFIKEDRYLLILSGLHETIRITLLSVFFGLILGFGIYFLCRKNRVGQIIFKVLDYILTGLPVVVLLMVFYYIVFSGTSLSSWMVAIITFSLLFTSSTVRSLKLSLDKIDSSQIEASLALGYREAQAMRKLIIPQAMDSFLYAIIGEVTTLLKATAIVGYIALQDLTKAADIIRGRTFDALFPLLFISIFYFLISFLLSYGISLLRKLIHPKRRSKKTILKGVKTHEN